MILLLGHADGWRNDKDYAGMKWVPAEESFPVGWYRAEVEVGVGEEGEITDETKAV